MSELLKEMIKIAKPSCSIHLPINFCQQKCYCYFSTKGNLGNLASNQCNASFLKSRPETKLFNNVDLRPSLCF